VEVNPLFITADGAVAIDAKVELDDYSLTSVPNRDLLPEQTESPRENEARLFQESDHRGSFRFVQLVDDGDADGDGRGPLVGSHSVGGGESLVVFDALEAVGLRPANYCDTSGAPSREKVAFAAELIASQPHIAGYFFSSCIANQPLSVTAGGLVDGFTAAQWRGPTVVRIAGNQEPEARAIVEAWAAEHDVPALVVGREVNEWEAAALLAGVLAVGSAG
jgi:succinyl-CoA synthetase beta subunit